MSKYKVTMVVTNIYDVEVEADSLAEAKDKAESIDAEYWVLDESAGSAELGDDHTTFNTYLNRWEYASE
jgi:hypothetical protein